MKTVNDLIRELQALKPSLRKLDVVVNAENGLQFEAGAKMQLSKDMQSIDKIVITYD